MLQENRWREGMLERKENRCRIMLAQFSNFSPSSMPSDYIDKLQLLQFIHDSSDSFAHFRSLFQSSLITVSTVHHRQVIGEDEFGYMLADILVENNVVNSGMPFDPHARTAQAFVTLRDDGEREFMFYCNPSADMLLHEDEIDANLIKKVKSQH